MFQTVELGIKNKNKSIFVNTTANKLKTYLKLWACVLFILKIKLMQDLSVKCGALCDLVPFEQFKKREQYIICLSSLRLRITMPICLDYL